jgi:tRNA(fMet)-specific endonuclease VapC
VRYLLDTDHISILQTMSGAEYVALSAHIALEAPYDFALSVASCHEQVIGVHDFIDRARTTQKVVESYGRFARLQNF